MPYCPQCGTEYRPGFNLCADCEVELVESLPEELMPRFDEAVGGFRAGDYETLEPVPVISVTSRIDGEIVLSALRSAGLRAYLAGTGIEYVSEAGGIGQITRAPGPLNDIRVMVHPDDVDEAREIIAAANPPSSSDEVQRALDAGEDASFSDEDGMAWNEEDGSAWNEEDGSAWDEGDGTAWNEEEEEGERAPWPVDPVKRKRAVRGLAVWYLFIPLTGVGIALLIWFLEVLSR